VIYQTQFLSPPSLLHLHLQKHQNLNQLSPVNNMFLQFIKDDGCNQKTEINVTNVATTLHSPVAFLTAIIFFATLL
jgi:hypothetical protein